jgi:pyruvate/2-oxoglutarate dehydrogenase complex dihydrolipoamide acyltransferase (E2) component
MAGDVVVPEVGEAGMEVTFVRWLKSAGDPVAIGEMLFELDTDKTVVEVEAWTAGILVDLLVTDGDIVRPRQVIAHVVGVAEDGATQPGSNLPSHPAVGEPPGTVFSSRVPGESPPADPTPAAAGGASGGASPVARRLARERGLDINSITGTGPDGLVTERDVLAVDSGGGS